MIDAAISKQYASPTGSAFAQAHDNYVKAMRDLIRLGLPLIEISKEQAEKVAERARSLADLYDNLLQQGSANVTLIIDCSMKARQIINSMPGLYEPMLRMCLFTLSRSYAQIPTSPEYLPPISPPGTPGGPAPNLPPAPVEDPVDPNQPGAPGVPAVGDPPLDAPIHMTSSLQYGEGE